MKISFLRLLTLIAVLFFNTIFASGQNGYKVGDQVQKIEIKKFLNTEQSLTDFNSKKEQLLLIDFFGTWCVPCIRALPLLTSLQQKYKDQLFVVLISNEEEARLQKFLSARKGFSLPVVADEDNSITNLFQPPAYPYTVILKDGKLIAITEAGSITEKDIDNWLKSKSKAEPEIKIPVSESPKTNFNEVMNTTYRSANTLVRLSQDYMYAAKTGETTSAYEQQLKTVSLSDLVNQLKTDDEKKAFWINLYNGYVQATLSKNPEAYKSRSAFFKSKQLKIAGLELSLDDIEHGFLRRSKIKWSAGYLNKLFPGKTEKQLRVEKLDYRLHFALNCGAKSCPPIAFYNPENLNKQLDIAATAYLTGEAAYEKEQNTVALSAIMGWFRKDFGGKKGMIRLLKEKAIIPNDAHPKIKFKQYDWTLYLNNYQN